MKHRITIILTILLCILAGCGRGGDPSQATLTAENNEERPKDDWRGGEWKFDTLSTGSKHDLYVSKYVQHLQYADESSLPYEPEESSVYFAGGRIYELDTFVPISISGEKTQPVYYLNCYDSGTGDIWHRQFVAPVLEEYPGQTQILQRLDILNEGEYVLYLGVYSPDNEVLAYVALRTDSDGKRLSATDLYPAMRENGVKIQDNYGYTKVYADQQGYFYLLCGYGLAGLGEGEILVLGSNGEMVDRIGSDAPGASARYVMKDPDGNAVFEVYDSQEQQLELWEYHAADGRKRYAQIQLEKGMSMAMSPEGYVYYGTQEGCLYRWDLYTGIRELCMDYQSMGMDPARVHIGMGNSGEPFLFQEASTNALICLLGPEPGMAQESIRLLSVCPHTYITKCAMDYSLEHADCVIQIENLEYGSTYYDQRDRALADLVAGKGADIYYVSGDDMDMLYEKGALADLTDVLPEEYKEVIFPGALELGTIDGRLIGLAPTASVSTMVVDRTLWPEDHWTLREALELKESVQGKNYLMCSEYKLAGYGNNLSVYLYNLADSPFLDLDAGTCDFTNPLFVQVLEMIGEEEKNNGTTEERGMIAYQCDISTFGSYNNATGRYYNKVRDSDTLSPIGIDAFGYPYYLVGYPTESGMGSYWDCYGGYVVVNKNTEHWEQVKEFLISLYDYDRQRENVCCARNDLTKGHMERVTGHPYYGDCLLCDGDYVYENPEGGIWLEEYIEFMNSCAPRRRGTAEIEKIITEEAGSFFAGDKDAQTVAELIQNRVQLYLNERSR